MRGALTPRHAFSFSFKCRRRKNVDRRSFVKVSVHLGVFYLSHIHTQKLIPLGS